MTTPTADRSHESIINDALARFLRERCNLPSAAAETLRGEPPGRWASMAACRADQRSGMGGR